MKTIIAGSRDIPAEVALAGILACPWYDAISEVVSEPSNEVGAQGRRWARVWQLPMKSYRPKLKHGSVAGAICHREMAQYADALIAVWDGKSRGTCSMISEAHAAKIRVFIWRTDQ